MYNSGGTHVWEINNATGIAGNSSGWDLNSIAGILSIGASAADRFNIEIHSLTSGILGGEAQNFDRFSNYDSVSAIMTSISNFNPNSFNLNISSFSNSITGTAGNGMFSTVRLSGNHDLAFRYTAAAILLRLSGEVSRNRSRKAPVSTLLKMARDCVYRRER